MCNFCESSCYCHICPPCGHCEAHMICDICDQQVCDDKVIEVLNKSGDMLKICPECYDAGCHNE